MYTVAGATGNVGSAVADYLLNQGELVRVIARNPAKAQPWADRGADVVQADFDQPEHTANAIRGSRGIFLLLPMDLTVDDFAVRSKEQVENIVSAVAASGVPHVVLLSSAGAHRADKNGPISALYHLETALRRDTDAVVTALRPGHFQEKVLEVLEVAQSEKIYPVFADSAQREIPMVATKDIGHEAARALLNPPNKSESVDLVGPAFTETEVGKLLGEALSADLTIVPIPAEQRAEVLQQQGMSTAVAELLAELYAADDAGLLEPWGDRSIRVHTPLAETIAHLVPRPAR